MKKIIIFSSIICFFLLFLYGATLLYIGQRVYFDDKVKSDAILVLGAKSYKGEVYNPCLLSRVEHAVSLYKKNYAPKIIMSGGDDSEDGRNEADTMAQMARERGVAEADILLERKSTSSYENLLYSRKIIQEKKLSSVIIVTEPFHSPRVALVAQKMGLSYSVSPTLTSQCWQRWTFASRFFLREPFALLAYLLQGKI